MSYANAGFQDDGLFNGIANLSAPVGNSLDCYAFIMNSSATANAIKAAFNSGGQSSYGRTAVGVGGLSGTTDSPALVSSQANLDVSGMGKYKLILTGMDTPMINEGEATPLYYGGSVVPGYEETAQNYSVVYRFNVTGFTGTKVTVEFNDRTNPGFIPDPDAGIYAIACVDGEETQYETLLQPKYAGFDTVMDVDIDTGTSSFTIEIVISSMSTLPATVIFE